MYKNPKDWMMMFQSYCMLTLLNLHTQKTAKSIKIIERSLFSSRICFAEYMMNTGILHRGMYNVLNEWYEHIEKTVHLQTDLRRLE
jgi:deoxyadenosine/deoxycytidine kinase